MGNDGHGIAGSIHLALHPDDEEGAAKCDMGFSIGMAGLALIASVAAFFIPGAQGMAMGMMAQSIQSFATIGSAAIAIANATGDATVAVIKYDAAQTRAEGVKSQAEAKEMEGWIKQIDDFIDQALQRLMGAMDRFNAMLDGIMEAINDQAKSVAKAKFTG
jgi:Na+/H+-dicarboxylate symporter